MTKNIQSPFHHIREGGNNFEIVQQNESGQVIAIIHHGYRYCPAERKDIPRFVVTYELSSCFVNNRARDTESDYDAFDSYKKCIKFLIQSFGEVQS